MKNLGLLISSICIFLVILVNLYYNSITLDMQKMKYYILESNIILEDIVEKNDYVNEKKDEYVERLVKIKKGMESSHTSFLVSNYKEYKIKSIECLIYSITYSSDEYLNEASRYNTLGEEELDKLVNHVSI